MDAREFGLKLGTEAAKQGLTVPEGMERRDWERAFATPSPHGDIEAFRSRFPRLRTMCGLAFEKAYLEAAFDEVECIPASRRLPGEARLVPGVSLHAGGTG